MKLNSMDKCGGMGVWLHALLTSERNGSKWPSSGCFNSELNGKKYVPQRQPGSSGGEKSRYHSTVPAGLSALPGNKRKLQFYRAVEQFCSHLFTRVRSLSCDSSYRLLPACEPTFRDNKFVVLFALTFELRSIIHY
jgi:hypothetical protein